MSDLDYISSSGIRVLLLMYKKVSQEDSFHLLDVHPEVKKIFDETGFSHFFVINS